MREPDVQLRYDPLVRFVRAHPGTVLEVGGGIAGIAPFLNRQVTGCDPYFLGRKGKRADWRGAAPHPNIIPVGGSATKIPFPDNHFDIVLSTDMLEHLERAQRKVAIQECVRVSKKFVLIGFPCGASAAKWEARLFSAGKKIFGKEHRWLKEHLQYGIPSEQEVIKLLYGLSYRMRGHINVWLWATITILSAVATPLGWLLYPFARIGNFPPYYRRLIIIEKQ